MFGKDQAAWALAALISLLTSLAAEPAAAQAVPAPPEESATLVIPAGTRLLLVTRSSLSTRTARNGDGFYALVDYPVFVDQNVVIPADSLIRGVVLDVRRGGRVHGRAQVVLGLEQLTLVNGVQKAFRAEILNIDASAEAAAVQSGGRLQAPSDTRRDAQTLINAGSQGAAIGAIAGGGQGLAIGSAAGALAGLTIMLSTRGGDLDVPAGTPMEVVLQAPLEFSRQELDFSKAPIAPPARRDSPQPVRSVEPAPSAPCCAPYPLWPVHYGFWLHFP